MVLIVAERTIPGALREVFSAFADPTRAMEVVPDIKSVERLPGPLEGVGARFKETRKHGKGSMTMEFEVTEYDPPNGQRIKCMEHGTMWDSSFRFKEAPEGTHVRIEMNALGMSLLPRLLNPLMKPLFRKGLEGHLDAVDAFFGGETPSP